jgi:hypothetical protein
MENGCIMEDASSEEWSLLKVKDILDKINPAKKTGGRFDLRCV